MSLSCGTWRKTSSFFLGICEEPEPKTLSWSDRYHKHPTLWLKLGLLSYTESHRGSKISHFCSVYLESRCCFLLLFFCLFFLFCFLNQTSLLRTHFIFQSSVLTEVNDVEFLLVSFKRHALTSCVRCVLTAKLYGCFGFFRDSIVKNMCCSPQKNKNKSARWCSCEENVIRRLNLWANGLRSSLSTIQPPVLAKISNLTGQIPHGSRIINPRLTHGVTRTPSACAVNSD